MTLIKKYRKLIGFFCCAVFIVLSGFFLLRHSEIAPVTKGEDGDYLPSLKTDRLIKIFEEHNYKMADYILNQKSIPRLFVRSVPHDFNRSKYDDVRPALFVEMMMPVILKANQQVDQERIALMELKKSFDQKGSLSPQEQEELSKISRHYNIREDDLSTLFVRLIPHVDSIPPTLLLAMSADATGWATNRFAREHNALFMEKDWEGRGVMPDEEQKPGPQYRIKTFPTVYDSVVSYIYYLNTGSYFENFRTSRLIYRRDKENPNGYLTAGMLVNFPYKTFKYPDILRHLIKQYNLFLLDLQELEPMTKQ